MSPLPWLARPRYAPRVVVAAAAPYPPQQPMRVTPPPQPAPRREPDESATRYRDPYPWQARQAGMEWLHGERRLLDLLADRGGDLTAHQAVHMEET